MSKSRFRWASVVLLATVVVGGMPSAEAIGAEDDKASTWSFVSMPDFLNVDTVYPQPGWEDSLGYILKSVKSEDPEFLLVAGDLVMGRWWTEADIEKYAAVYYPAWVDRIEAHGLKFYPAIGDHELGDNPWPPERAKLVPQFKREFCVRVSQKRLELELKEIDMAPSGDHLWQVGNNRPLQRVTISDDVRRRGFVPVGRLVVDKSAGEKVFRDARGYFLKRYEPQKPERYVPAFRSGRGIVEPPRVIIE